MHALVPVPGVECAELAADEAATGPATFVGSLAAVLVVPRVGVALEDGVSAVDGWVRAVQVAVDGGVGDSQGLLTLAARLLLRHDQRGSLASDTWLLLRILQSRVRLLPLVGCPQVRTGWRRELGHHSVSS